MRHPFDGVAPPGQEQGSTRRGVLKWFGAAVAGLLGLGASRAEAHGRPRPPRPTTYALGEEGGRWRPTTYRYHEEGGRVTTYALGEEGGRPPSTYRYHEEGGFVTTRALGEEGGQPRPW